MFGTPDTIRAEVFAALPEELKLSGQRSEWTRQRAHAHAAPSSFLEGPSVARDGTIFCTDIPFGRIFRIDATSGFAVFHAYDGEPNGMKIHADGRLIIADHKLGLIAIDPQDGSRTVLFDRPFGERFRGLNDLHLAPDGAIYMTDQGQSDLRNPDGRLFRLNADGTLDLLLDGIPGPNGLVLNGAGDTLFLAVTRANAVWRVPLAGRGRVGKVGVHVSLSGGIGPDGLAMDAEDGLLVAHTGRGTVWRFDRHGELTHRLVSPKPGGRTTNLAFAPGGHRLFVTESDTARILTAEMPFPGASRVAPRPKE